MERPYITPRGKHLVLACDCGAKSGQVLVQPEGGGFPEPRDYNFLDTHREHGESFTSIPSVAEVRGVLMTSDTGVV